MKIGKIRRFLLRPQKSIKDQIRFSYILIISIMILPAVYSVFVSRAHTRQYDGIITNVSRANELNQTVKISISDEIWDIVAGKKKFSEGDQYIILREIRSGIADMYSRTAPEKNRQLLEVAARAEKTLEKHVDRLGEQMKNGAKVSETEKTLEDVRGVASLITDILQDFIVAEIQSAALTNESIRISSRIFTAVQIIITICAALLAYSTIASVSENIRNPIYELEKLSARIASGDFAARAKIPDVDELNRLTENLNTMAGKILGLMNENIREQQNLKKAEMKTLQAQITPHFLYNTLDTIVWLAEDCKTDEVIEITKALSRFFRISLSRGHEWITVKQEMEHVESYLFIQQVRYRDILNYEVAYDPQMAETPCLKLILQPIVENAIYHGIKNKRGRGHLSIGGKIEGGRMIFTISDDGIGMTPARLAEVQQELDAADRPEELVSVYGLYNVSKRLKLYYNYDVIFKIESIYRKGTKITLNVPVIYSNENLSRENDA